MENSGLLISPRNINPIPSMSGSDFTNVKLLFNFRNLPPTTFHFSVIKVKCPTRRSLPSTKYSTRCLNGVSCLPSIDLSASDATILGQPCYGHEAARFLKINILETSHATSEFIQQLVLVDLDPATAKLAISFLGPFLSAFGFLFILRIVMSWYPKLPVEKFPYVIAYAPTEPLLSPTRKLIPPLGGVDVTPVVWFGLVSFLNEILVGPQGLLVLLSQQV